MLYIAENLKNLRKRKDLTQEEVAEMLGVTAQSVSKWERGDTMPDITLLPALSNLYKVSVDELLGMERIDDRQTRNAIFTRAQNHLRNGNINAAVEVFFEALKTYPNDEGIMSDLAMSLALVDDPAKLSQAIALCERVLAENQGGKVHHTTRAALCFIYLKVGEKEKAVKVARNLPHVRESREIILAQIEKALSADEIDSNIKFIALGGSGEQDIIAVDFGINMLPICTEHNLVAQIEKLRNEIGAPQTKAGYRKLPQVRVRDNCELSPNQVRVRHYADYLLDEEFSDHADAINRIMMMLRKISKV